MPRVVETILTGLDFAEGPRWHHGELYFSDMHAHEVVAMKPDASRRTVLSAQGPISGLGWLPDGRLLIASMEDRQLLRQETDGTVCVHADLSSLAAHHINDMVVDRKGRAYVGNFGFSVHPPSPVRPARLVRVDPDGSVHSAVETMFFPNGMAISENGATLFVAESYARLISVFALDADGILSDRRVFTTMPGDAAPDGICLDADGAMWVACPPTRQILRVSSQGAVLEAIELEQMPFACMLGGEDRRTLYILTNTSYDPSECRGTGRGCVVACRVEVPGTGLP